MSLELKEPEQCAFSFPKVINLKTELLSSLQELKKWKQQYDQVNFANRLQIIEDEIIKIKQKFAKKEKELQELKSQDQELKSPEVGQIKSCELELIQLECDYNDYMMEHAVLKPLISGNRVVLPDVDVFRQKVRHCLFALINQALREMNGTVDIWRLEDKCLKRVQIQVIRHSSNMNDLFYFMDGKICCVTRLDKHYNLQKISMYPKCLPGFDEAETTTFYKTLFETYPEDVHYIIQN